MSTRNIIAFILIAMVLGITLLALLGIWDLIQWEYVQRYFWKSIQSLIVILVSSVVVYLIQQMFHKEESNTGKTSI
jgi:Na+/H+-dicarboxylate symporter